MLRTIELDDKPRAVISTINYICANWRLLSKMKTPCV